jgi:hypothetical protein
MSRGGDVSEVAAVDGEWYFSMCFIIENILN